MTFNAASTVFSIRLIVFLAILFVALAFGSPPAGADDDDDESGSWEDGPTLVGSGPERELVADEEQAVLVGSGPERETVAQDEQAVLVGSGPERETVAQDEQAVLVGSGPERETVAHDQESASGTLDESERSAALIDLTADDTVATGSAFDLEFGQSANVRAIALIESKEAPGGVLAGGEAIDTTASGNLDETTRSADLIALTADSSVEYAEMPEQHPR